MKHLLALVLVAAPLATSVSAQDISFGNRWGTLSADVGLGVSYGPKFPGSSDQEANPWGIMRNASFGTPGEGELDGFSVLPSFGYIGKRDPGDDDRLNGLKEISRAYEAGLQFGYGTGPVLSYARVRQGFGGHHGITGEMGVRYQFEVNDKLTLWTTLEATYGDSDYMDRYFGVSASESAASGYREYNPGSGFTKASAKLAARYAVGEKYAIWGEAEYGRLVDDAKNAPFVEDKDQPVFRLGVTRNFSFGF